MKPKKSFMSMIRHSVFLIAIVAVAILMAGSPSVFAGHGPGSTGQGKALDGCKIGTQWTGSACKDGTKTGGVSWHVFRVTGKIDKHKVYVNGPTSNKTKGGFKFKINGGGPTYTTSIGALKGDEYGKSLGKTGGIAGQCPKDSYQFYVAFVYDGWYKGTAKNKKHIYTFYGPAANNVAFKVGKGSFMPRYNPYDHHSYSDVVNALEDGKEVHGWRLSKSAALKFYKKYMESKGKNPDNYSQIPTGLGYFCYPYGKTLTLKAVSTEGKNISGIEDKTKSVNKKGDPADITRRTDDAWTFKGFATTKEKAKSGSYVTTTDSSKSHYLTNDGKTYNEKSLTEDKTIYAVYEKKTRTLTAKAIDTDGHSLSSVIPDVVDEVNYGKKAKVTRTKHSDYTFKGWKLTKDSDSYFKKTKKKSPTHYVSGSKKQTYNVASLTENKKVYAVYKAKGNCTGCQCDNSCPEDPCAEWNTTPSSFLESSKESGTTSTASRVRNTDLETYGEWAEEVYAKPGDDVNFIHCYYPGVQMTADTKISTNHKTSNNPGAREHNGNPDYSYTLENKKVSTFYSSIWENQFKIGSGVTSSHHSVSFNSVDNGRVTSGNGSNIIQYKEETNNNITTRMGGSKIYESITSGTPKSVTTKNEGTHSWEYDYGGTGEYKDGACKKYNDDKSKCLEYEQVEIQDYRKSAEHTNDFISHTINTGKASSRASVIVPYNFENTTEVTNEPGEVVFPGENKTVTFDLVVNPRDNDLTDGYYSTRVDSAKYRVEVCYQDTCGYYSAEKSESLNTEDSDEVVEEPVSVARSISIDIPDAPAGSEVCVMSQVYPATSGDFANFDDVNGDYQWSSSEPVCFTVAKRPSMQVWGGNVYTQGQIKTTNSVKRSLFRYASAPYTPAGGSTKYVFGSFGELGVLAAGTVNGFASGGISGYVTNTNGLLSPNPFGYNSPENTPNVGGNNSDTMCNNSPLTFANNPCYSYAGMIGSGVYGENIAKDKESVLKKYIEDLEDDDEAVVYDGGDDTGDTGDDDDDDQIDSDADFEENDEMFLGVRVDLNSPENLGTDNIAYFQSQNDLMVGAQNEVTYVNKGTIQVVHSQNTVFVDGDIVYGGSYSSLSDVPKLVLYGKNIVIGCNVSRLEALLIADKNVITCDNFAGEPDDADVEADIAENISEAVNSRQLRVNGAILASKLIPNRTYGAAAGANSVVPAEIINYDPTLYLWGGATDEDGSEDSNIMNMVITSIKEVPPRQ